MDAAGFHAAAEKLSVCSNGQWTVQHQQHRHTCTTNACSQLLPQPYLRRLLHTRCSTDCSVVHISSSDLDDILLEESAEDEDPACYQQKPTQRISSSHRAFLPSHVVEWIFDIVYSDIWGCPVLYFTATNLHGMQLSMSDMAVALGRSTLLHTQDLNMDLGLDLGLGLTNSTPQNVVWDTVISMQDHPIHLLPCWVLHPCNTVKAMRELVVPEMSDLQCLVLWLSMGSRILDIIDLIDSKTAYSSAHKPDGAARSGGKASPV
ncbi:hypothetical protein BSLG_006098 [Batrachochytrium salamandrivorans]|nr:hypothetical protein BSLG_006098 [Batrachochytrium salamandrivorans]